MLRRETGGTNSEDQVSWRRGTGVQAVVSSRGGLSALGPYYSKYGSALWENILKMKICKIYILVFLEKINVSNVLELINIVITSFSYL